MALFMWQAAYTPESWAVQLKNPQNRVETVGRQACESAGGKLIGAWYCFGDYDIIIVADMPDAESMAAVSLAITAGGACKTATTTTLMSGDQAVAAMKKATTVSYKPAGR
jgi:uncharacterized protein with GYD domain